jgi:hypothetical protein
MNKKTKLFFLGLLMLIGISSAVFQYVKTFQSEIASAYDSNAPANGHSWAEMQCTSDLCIDTVNHRVGVGTDSPTAVLDVNGVIKLGTTTATCDSSLTGALRYSGGSLQACNGSAWTGAAGSTYGTAISNPGLSCLDIKNNNSGAIFDGNYYITLGGTTVMAYCNMTLADGGWTLVASQSAYHAGNHNYWLDHSTSTLPSSIATTGADIYKGGVNSDTKTLYVCKGSDGITYWFSVDKISIMWNNTKSNESGAGIIRATSGNFNSSIFNTVGGTVYWSKWYYYSGDGPQTSLWSITNPTVSIWGGNSRPYWTTEYVGCNSGSSYALSSADQVTPKFWIYVK